MGNGPMEYPMPGTGNRLFPQTGGRRPKSCFRWRRVRANATSKANVPNRLMPRIRPNASPVTSKPIAASVEDRYRTRIDHTCRTVNGWPFRSRLLGVSCLSNPPSGTGHGEVPSEPVAVPRPAALAIPRAYMVEVQEGRSWPASTGQRCPITSPTSPGQGCHLPPAVGHPIANS
jgi:hypothetical protein